MKNLLLVFILCFVTAVSAQNINQLDTNGKRNGIWKKYFEGTKVLRYEGQFKHGKETGLFKFYKNIDGKASLTATKQFNDTDHKAYVTFFTSTGKVVSEGEMDGKTYIGEWKYYQKTNKKLLTLENYDENGNLDGDRFVYYENGQIAEKQHYKHGKLDGNSIWYTEDNVVLKEYTYVNGLLDGPAKFYNSKGELLVGGSYKKDEKHGIWNYYENGKLVDTKDFTNPGHHIKKD
jgi:antitoxin component YwqK of YwqJK toxin-antitoxin module